MSDEDYDLFLRAVRRRSEDRELAEYILSLPLDQDEPVETAQTRDNNDIEKVNIDENSYPRAFPSLEEENSTSASMTEEPIHTEDGSTVMKEISLRPRRIFIPLKDHSLPSASENVISPPALNSSSSADSIDGNHFQRSPRVAIDPNSEHWIDEFVANFNQVYFMNHFVDSSSFYIS